MGETVDTPGIVIKLCYAFTVELTMRLHNPG